MPTTKSRINLTIPDELREPLEELAKLDNVRVSTKALELLKGAIEREEDVLWTELADERLTKKVKWISNDAVQRKYA
jgi:hypothetical protein